MLRSQRRVYDGVAKRHVRRTSGAPKALAVALSFCRLLGLGCPKQAFAKIATPRDDFKEVLWQSYGEDIVQMHKTIHDEQQAGNEERSFDDELLF